ncbi:substrate-binding domain-containing protein [Halococcus sp. IIIV-5B]|uniref:substrate-binding domain-containing protein n=1 Tax=Halococcus sp. IIIV-5B TaxID=2321230 RepID=UPI000E75F07B|nr:substrate-binding domain-containing protein [Halococcus sp. IIIV-5B]RJT05282.1 extracellular solute-binding protein [Halococcus sp. IIIV-5B]
MMRDEGDPQRIPSGRDVSRRTFVKTAGVAGAAVSLAGCTVGGTETSSNSIRWISSNDMAGESAAIKKALRNAGMSNDVDLEIVAGPANTDQRQSQYTRWLSADLEEPALLDMDSGWALNFINRDQLLNLSNELPENLLNRINNKYFSASVNTARGDNNDLYAVPMYPDFATMLYRKDLVQQAGYNPEQENWATESMRWKKFSKVVADTKRQSGVNYGFGFQGNIYEGLSCCDFNEFMTSWGGAYFGGRDTLLGPVGDRPVTVNQEPVVNAIKMLKTFVFGSNAPDTLNGYEQISPNAVLSWIEDSSLSPFTAGNMVALRNWPYAIAAAGAEDALGDRLGVMPIPYAVTEQQSNFRDIGGPTAALGGWHIGVNPNTPQREQAMEVIEALTQPSFQLELFELLGLLPPNQELLNTRRAKQIPIVGNYIETLQVAGRNAIPRPVSVVWPQQSGKIAQQVHAGMDGSSPPQQAMDTLQSQLTAIENYNG